MTRDPAGGLPLAACHRSWIFWTISTSLLSKQLAFGWISNVGRFFRQQQQSPQHNMQPIIPPIDTEPLLPEQNPSAAVDRFSAAGVRYSEVLDSVLSPLYPASKLSERVALSRSEGYWPYVNGGNNNDEAGGPPQELTYGEFDFYFFAQLLDQAAELHKNNTASSSWSNCVFTDLGSGTGRLVVAAAALHPFKLCRGIELLSGLNTFANQTTTTITQATNMSLQLAPLEFKCGSITDPYMYFGDSDVIFCFSTCMDTPLLEQTAQSIGRQCRPGTVVITTDYALPSRGFIPPVEDDDRVPSGNYHIACMDTIEGWCWLTGGASTAYLHVVEESLWSNDSPLEPPVLSLEDVALRVVKLYESGELTDTEAFKRNVYNNMVFHGMPERFYPKLKKHQ